MCHDLKYLTNQVATILCLLLSLSSLLLLSILFVDGVRPHQGEQSIDGIKMVKGREKEIQK